MKRARRGDVVEVEWDDSGILALGWAPVRRYIAETAGPPSYRTAGYLIARTNRKVVVALSLSLGTRTIADCMTIPTRVVSRVKILGRSSKRVRKALRP